MSEDDLNPDAPFVPRSLPFVDRSRGADDVREECKRLAREGAAAVHARAAVPSKGPQLTNAESAALARKRIDDEEARR